MERKAPPVGPIVCYGMSNIRLDKVVGTEWQTFGSLTVYVGKESICVDHDDAENFISDWKLWCDWELGIVREEDIKEGTEEEKD